MKLIIGLGNPGKEYENTRHNVGFEVIEKIAKDNEVDFEFNKKLNAEIAKISRLNLEMGQKSHTKRPAILAKPQTFVNKSGEAVKKLKLFYKTTPKDIVVIHDDLDIEFGNFKLSFAKDSGGHRGVQSVIDHLKTNKFWRLRVGTANRKLSTARQQRTLKQKKDAVGGFVLAKFTPAEQAELKKVIKKTLERLAQTF
ncbi:MAG: aminoacyl-tRNA hydrolase [Candidatus Yanofskybacteria bacterium RIFCSPHIGHO2_01_FULL_44_17]|uniref:Peptidyl-tRNA hydrolase n=1 Tax=Candidatus Yanofskybacteria bacterium RIFCSPHIGHO2_01_FULL_44_17 TaxID=1802668 RepID=A0A1F8EUK3_9BACT|nr:MAG: aminoacyl-tRNA hydrolase [Candidatus Yanofskybacteria bacterium RIFCSPHIGHO2_01_FULL_44_17]